MYVSKQWRHTTALWLRETLKGVEQEIFFHSKQASTTQEMECQISSEYVESANNWQCDLDMWQTTIDAFNFLLTKLLMHVMIGAKSVFNSKPPQFW